MRVYTPIELMKAVDKVEEEFSRSAIERRLLSDEELQELVLMIERKTWDELPALAAVLSRREIQALCRYLRTNSLSVDLNKIEKVIIPRMDSANFSLLFSVWEHAPECVQALRLLGEHDRVEYRPPDFKLPIGLLDRWHRASRPVAAAARTIAEENPDRAYRERVHLIGITYGTTLALECEKLFFLSAKLGDFIAEGDQSLEEILKRLSRTDKEAVILHLLKSAAGTKNALIEFRKTFRVICDLWGKPRRADFPQNHDIEFSVYLWWYNYNELFATLHGDPRRVRFWQNYMESFELSRDRSHHMLIMRHMEKNIVATEFEEIGAIYIFTAEYFDAVVKSRMRQLTATGKFKSWLVNYSTNICRETHQGYWEGRMAQILRRFGIR